MTEQELLEYFKKKTKADHEFWSNKNKPEREKYKVSLFLSILGLDYQEIELLLPPKESKIDVCFRDAAFQVKEIMDEGYPRNGIYKHWRKSAESAKKLEEIVWTPTNSEERNPTCYDVPTPDSMYHLTVKAILKQTKKYKVNERNELDLLFYITRTRASPFKPDEVQRAQLDTQINSYGWRSISCVNEKQAVVLYSSPSAPELIRKHTGTVITR